MTTESFARTRGRYLISSDPSILSLSVINAAFADPAMYWCKPLPEAHLQRCLENSFCLGLCLQNTSSSDAPGLGTAPKREQIGLARMITDSTTIAYITNVFVLEEEQGQGLGGWLVDCVNEVIGEMGYLRKAMLVASCGKGEEYYGQKLGMQRLRQEENGVVTMQRLGPGSGWFEQCEDSKKLPVSKKNVFPDKHVHGGIQQVKEL
ncbi:hypothetical protein MMC14_009040 [Varicellaria rhodocarpa]|nr:hypothetical protein [Varicellaria rhodocarpa]